MPPEQARHEYNSTSVRECQALVLQMQRKCSTPAKLPKGRVDHCAKMKKHGRRQRTHPGGPAKRGAKPADKLGASPEPQRGGGDGRGAGRTHQNSTAPQRSGSAGAKHRAKKHRGAKPKKRRLGVADRRNAPRCWSRRGPTAPKGASQGEPAYPGLGTAPGWRAQGQPEQSGGRPQPTGNRGR